MNKYFLSLLICFNVSITLSQDNPNIGNFGEDEFLINEEQSNSYITFEETTSSITLPNSIDLSNKFPAAGNQGSMGSCWAWATTYAYFSYVKNIDNEEMYHIVKKTFKKGTYIMKVLLDKTGREVGRSCLEKEEPAVAIAPIVEDREDDYF